MLLKTYTYLFLAIGLYTSWSACVSTPLSFDLHSLFLLTDILVSIGASIIMFRLAYRKLPRDRRIWCLLAISYIVFDLLYNLILSPVPPVDAAFCLALWAPSYVLCLRYAFGPMRADKAPLRELDFQLAERLALEIEQEEEARWAELEQRCLESKEQEDAGETIKIRKHQDA